jgi:hypothetical protein
MFGGTLTIANSSISIMMRSEMGLVCRTTEAI